MSVIALKVAIFAAALGIALYAMLWLSVTLLWDNEEKLKAGLSPDYLLRYHRPSLCVLLVSILCGVIALLAVVIAAGAFLVGV